MVAQVDTAEVTLWGERVGAVSWLAAEEFAVFEFAPDFLTGNRDVSPVHLPLAQARVMREPIFSFTHLNRETFRGLPGLLADSLPDRFGNSVIDAWLARQGRDAKAFSPVERLCYTGSRGMGALEFSPVINKRAEESVALEVAELTTLAQAIMSEREDLSTELSGNDHDNAEALLDILRVGTSAGGARPKAIIALDSEGNVRSGQTVNPPQFEDWLLKFDGVTDMELGVPKGYGRIEFAYYLMAKSAGILMSECRLLEESGRAHFLTRRFDRVQREKLHVQTLCGLSHFDFNSPGAYSYEQAFTTMRKLRLPVPDAIQQYRRMLFNVLARNQDDHTKNISYVMDKDGRWSLAPAYDVTYSHNPAGKWTNQHQMTINGKRDNFTLEDLLAVGKSISIKKPLEIIQEVAYAVECWPAFAKEAGLSVERMKELRDSFRFYP